MDNTIDFSTKEILKRNIAERLETTWNLSMAYSHLQKMDGPMLKDLQKFLIYKELTIDSDPKMKSKSGFAIQIIKTYKSIKNDESKNK